MTLIFKNFWPLMKLTFAGWLNHQVPKRAAALSFYAIFAMAPLVVILLAAVGFFFSHAQMQNELQTQLEIFVGESGNQVISSVVNASSNRRQGIFSAVLSLAAMLAMSSVIFTELQDDLNRIWNVQKSRYSGWKKFFYKRAVAVLMIPLVGAIFLLSLVISTILTVGIEWMTPYYQIREGLIEILNFLASFFLMSLLFALLFKFIPETKVKWKSVWIGAVATALLFNVGKSLIAFYLGRFVPASAYGAAGSVVLLLLWVYYNSQIFLIGAEFTHALEKLSTSRNRILNN